MRHLFLLFSIVISFSAPLAAQEQAPTAPEFTILAIVNDDVISSLDVAERARLIAATSPKPLSEAQQRRLLPTLLKQLIDERLQIQEAQKRNITVSEAELADAVAGLEAQNNKPAGSMQKHFESKGLPWKSFLQQLRSQLLWNKLLAQAVRPKVRISDAELERTASAPSFQEGEAEVNITPLVLPVPSPEEEAKVMAKAEKMAKALRDGASMETVMKAGDESTPKQAPRFWVSVAGLEPELAAALANASPGAVVGPVRTTRGVHVLQLNDRRKSGNGAAQIQIVAKDVLLTMDPDDTAKKAAVTMDIAREVQQNPGTCLDNTVAGLSDPSQAGIRVNFIRAPLDSLPDYARDSISRLKVGEVGEPFAMPNGIRFYMLCERVDIPGTKPTKPVKTVDRDAVQEKLFREKMELEAAKFMRDLQRNAFIELRV